MPASWCRLPAGHDYPSADGWDPQDIVFMRGHLAEGESASVQMGATEENRGGAVTVRPAGAFVTVSEDDYSAAGLCRLATELLVAAAVLEGLSQ